MSALNALKMPRKRLATDDYRTNSDIAPDVSARRLAAAEKRATVRFVTFAMSRLCENSPVVVYGGSTDAETAAASRETVSISMSRRDAHLLTLLLDSPWWISAAFASVSYVALRWLLPMWAIENVYIKLIVQSLSPLAVPVAVFFLLLAVLAAFRRGVLLPGRSRLRAGAHSSQRRGPDVAAEERPFPDLPTKPMPHRVDVDLLKIMDWKRFEELAAEYFRARGFIAHTFKAGADGGVDIKVHKKDTLDTVAFVQCKAWRSKPVGVKEIRAFFGAMVADAAPRGIFMTTSDFTQEAVDFAVANKIELISGARFVELIAMLPELSRNQLLDIATEGDYTTPTCASCGIKMVRRSGPKGLFWGCTNYPRCRTVLSA